MIEPPDDWADDATDDLDDIPFQSSDDLFNQHVLKELAKND